jgi:Caspase domain
MIDRRPSGCLALLALLGSVALCGEARAARFAVLVGNNEGQGGDAHLRFAESDTARLAALLTRLGGFDNGGTVVLLARTADELQRTLVALADRLRTTPGEHMVLVYYSGHADAQALHLGSSVFPLLALRETVDALPAATRVLILDACQAGVLTRPKGGRPGSGFEVDLGRSEATKGLAILAASSGSELAQESDQLRASVFTHFLEVGLSGLADRNRDGNVSLGEVFDYTADHTLAATMGTTTGPQHPTFRLDLTGRDDLILTRPGLSGAGYGQLRLDVPGWYFVRRGDGTIAAEVVSHGDDTLALEPGLYEVTRRERNELDVATLSVGDGTATAISRTTSRPVAFGRMVRKGGGPEAAYGLAVATAVRSSLEDLGVSAGVALAARADFSAASFELRLGLGRAQQASEHFSSTTWDLSAAGAVLRMHDAGALGRGSSLNLTWGFGAEVGLSYMAQTLDDGASAASWNPFLGPVALAELSLGRRFFVRVDLGVPIYALRVQTADASSSTSWRPALSSALGAGSSF